MSHPLYEAFVYTVASLIQVMQPKLCYEKINQSCRRWRLLNANTFTVLCKIQRVKLNTQVLDKQGTNQEEKTVVQ